MCDVNVPYFYDYPVLVMKSVDVVNQLQNLQN